MELPEEIKLKQISYLKKNSFYCCYFLFLSYFDLFACFILIIVKDFVTCTERFYTNKVIIIKILHFHVLSTHLT